MSDFVTVSRAALQALEAGERVALCTVVRARGSAPRHAGARMLLWEDGRTVGTIGGATLEQRALEEAAEALADGRSRLVNYVFNPRGGSDSVGLCGGAVDIYIEVLEPSPTLLIIGAGHVAMPLAEMGAAIGMRVTVVDDRPEYLTRERFPRAERLEAVAYEPETEQLAPLPVSVGAGTFVVVATWGWDEPVLAQLLRRPAAYVALVASKTKARVIRERLLARGLTAEQVGAMHAPAGLDVGAETPAEIALAILGQILAVRRQRTAWPLATAGPESGPMATAGREMATARAAVDTGREVELTPPAADIAAREKESAQAAATVGREMEPAPMAADAAERGTVAASAAAAAGREIAPAPAVTADAARQETAPARAPMTADAAGRETVPAPATAAAGREEV